MNYLKHQQTAKSNITLLIILFLVAIVGISSLTAYIFVLFVDHTAHLTSARNFENFKLMFWVIFIIITVATLVRMWMNPKGTEVAIMLGGELVPTNTTDPKERQLLNVVEEMAIASGMPVPATYILKNNLTINAFTAGSSAFDAVIGVNKGTIIALDRSELQAVIAHEFSHILNEDVKLNLQTTAAIGGLMMIANIGRGLMESEPSYTDRTTSRSALSANILGVVIFAIGSLGVILSRFIQSTISHQREYHADATSTQFTRNPEAMAQALAKIGFIAGSLVESSYNYEMDHIFFCSAIGSSFFDGFFPTHPRIEERIKRISSQFNIEDFLKSLPNDTHLQNHQKHLQAHRVRYAKQSFSYRNPNPNSTNLNKISEQNPKRNVSRNPDFESSKNVSTSYSSPITQVPFKSNLSEPQTEHLNYASSILQALPIEITNGVRNINQAKIILVMSIFYFQTSLMQEQMMNEILKQSEEDRRLAHQTLSLLDEKPNHHLILITLVLNTLRTLDFNERIELTKQIKLIFMSDKVFSFFEMITLLFVENSLLVSNFNQKQKTYRLSNLKPEIENLIYWFLSSFHQEINTSKLEQIKKKYYGILSNLAPSNSRWESQPPLEYENLKSVFAKLIQLPASDRKKLIQILFVSLTGNDFSNLENNEKLRLVSLLLKIPLPPILT